MNFVLLSVLSLSGNAKEPRALYPEKKSGNHVCVDYECSNCSMEEGGWVAQEASPPAVNNINVESSGKDIKYHI